MTLFRHPDLKAAYQHVGAGGQALFIRRRLREEPTSAWLIDSDGRRLYETARMLGVRRIRFLREGREGQCIQLTGHPLTCAINRCAQKEMAL